MTKRKILATLAWVTVFATIAALVAVYLAPRFESRPWSAKVAADELRLAGLSKANPKQALSLASDLMARATAVRLGNELVWPADGVCRFPLAQLDLLPPRSRRCRVLNIALSQDTNELTLRMLLRRTHEISACDKEAWRVEVGIGDAIPALYASSGAEALEVDFVGTETRTDILTNLEASELSTGALFEDLRVPPAEGLSGTRARIDGGMLLTRLTAEPAKVAADTTMGLIARVTVDAHATVTLDGKGTDVPWWPRFVKWVPSIIVAALGLAIGILNLLKDRSSAANPSHSSDEAEPSDEDSTPPPADTAGPPS